jgi:hypothetical protein
MWVALGVTGLVLSGCGDDSRNPDPGSNSESEAPDSPLAEYIGDSPLTVGGGGGIAISIAEDREPTDEDRHLTFDDMDGCIIFKYHGSIDVRKSCIITSERLFQLTRADRVVPNAGLPEIALACRRGDRPSSRGDAVLNRVLAHRAADYGT